uniref:TlpA family protein disulfide reductase n=1 Tax=Pedobacter schmidteae TaxID=2201271 RepID=UPI000EB23555|nr:TlpA disulfide reductase family protein [Pedobacter schmidteae]
MKSVRLLISTICVFLTYISCVSGTCVFSSQPKISGIFTAKEKPDSVAVAVLSRFSAPPLSFQVKVGERGDFTFKLPQSNHVQLFKIWKISKDKYEELGKYYAEPNDNIVVHIVKLSKDSLFFSGNGAPKYNLIESINKDYRHFVEYREKWPSIFTYQNIDNYFNDLSRTIDFFNNKKTKSIREFEKTVSLDVRNIIEFQFADYFSVWNSHLQLIYLKHCVGKPELESLVRNYFNRFKNIFFLRLDDRLSTFSPRVLTEFENWHKTYLILNSKTGLIDLTEYYNSVKKNSSKMTKEALLTTFFRNKETFTNIKDFNPNTYDSLVLDAQQYITSLDAKKIISAKTKVRAGTTLYDANFIDSKGKYVSTSSLKGKVVFIDFWGDGCGGCLNFHRWFEKNIWPEFKDNDDFVFLSISVDKDEQVWLKNIEKYSSKEYLNVNTYGLGLLGHPFAKHYNIQSLPSLMLIDKRGKIISQINLGISSVDLIKLIKSGLDSSVSK